MKIVEATRDIPNIKENPQRKTNAALHGKEDEKNGNQFEKQNQDEVEMDQDRVIKDQKLQNGTQK